MSESSGLVVTGQLAAPGVEGCVYVGEVQGEGCEDQAVAGGGVPEGFVSLYGFLTSRGRKPVRLYIAARL